jgi:hypothetical protein
MSTTARCNEIGILLEARALQLQAHGKEREAFDHLVVLLALSRHLRHHALVTPYYTGQALEGRAVRGLERLLSKPDIAPALGRLALKELARHEAATPLPTESVKAQYFNLRRRFDATTTFLSDLRLSAYEAGSAEAELVNAAWLAPWERQRHLRLVRALCAAALQVAETEAWELPPTLEPVPDRYSALAHDYGLAPLKDKGRAVRPRQWGRLLYASPWLQSQLDLQRPQRPAQRALLHCRLRALRIKLALLLYRAEKGQLPQSLAQLVPAYLESLPPDPFSGQAFRYRISAGERIRWFAPPGDSNAEMRTVTPGQGVLWSVGPDLADDGGTRQGERQHLLDVRTYPKFGHDLIYLIPTRKQP